jgi:hypothetical protein
MTLLRVSVAALITFNLAACRTTQTPEADTGSAVKDTDNAAAAPYKVIISDTFEPEVEALGPDELTVCSFNVSFVGHWKARDKKSQDIANLLAPCDLVAVQELVAPPTDVGLDASGKVHYWLDQDKMLKREAKKDDTELIETFTPWWSDKLPPSGSKIVEEWEGDYQALHFVGNMKKAGWDYVLSVGDTGKSTNHNNSTLSEWHIVFYRPGKVMPAPETEVPTGWTLLDPAEPLAAHPVFDRVPYGFGFRTVPRADGKQLDFVLINVHLHSTQTRLNEKEKEAGEIRAREIVQIQKWIAAHNAKTAERDYIILGDMNIVDGRQLQSIKTTVAAEMAALGLPGGDTLASLNQASVPTNVSTNDPKPFDQVIFDTKNTTEIVRSKAHGADMILIDLAKKFKFDADFGGVSSNFIKAYSDHVPLMFVMKIGNDDD